MSELDKIAEILDRARRAAIDYYALTGKPLGITGEIGEYFTAKLLDLKLLAARSPGCDALDGKGRKIQIKARRILQDKRLGGQRVGSIRLDHAWDSVMLILLDESFEPLVIYQADRDAVAKALKRPGSKARNERGALSISKFISIGHKVWQPS